MAGKTAELKQLDVQTVNVKIRGLSPVILHRWSDKAKKEMLDKQMKKTVKKEAKSPEEQFEASVYRLEDGTPAFPADGFKKAMIRGAKQLGLTMTDMRTGFFVHGEYSQKEDRELVPINGELQMREDPVRNEGNKADIRYRGQVVSWDATLNITYNAAVVSFDYIVNMLNAAGFGVGVGDWRPERDGIFGRFEVVPGEQ
jgi:hypothetical protein